MGKKCNYPWPYWMGIRGFYFVWHGAWADPEIVWHGYVMNMHYVEDVVWEQFCDIAKEQCIEMNDDNFAQFCKTETWRLREAAQGVIDCGNAKRIKLGVFKDVFDLCAIPKPEWRKYPITL